jgi:hypothetical protein
MIPWQVQIETALRAFPQISALMQARWGWPIAESAHFIGLTLLFGSIAAWDLRLVGMLRDVPVTAFHRLVPWAVAGFGINALTGLLFLMTYPDQYVYNAAFQLKMLCLVLAGLNVALFYAVVFRPGMALARGVPPPPLARLCGAVSITLWITVIVCGRMITFFRPAPCDAAAVTGFLASCIVR